MNLNRLFITLLLAVPLGLLAQDDSCESLLEAAYGTEKLENLVSQNADGVDFLCFQNNNGYYMTSMPPGKTADSFPDILESSTIDAEIFPNLTLENIESGVFLAGYEIPVLPKHYGYYSIGDSDQLFVVYPQNLIRSLYEKQ